MTNNEIAQQWAQLVEDYGDLAHLMMEYDAHEFDEGLHQSMGDYPRYATRGFQNNEMAIFYIEIENPVKLEIRRKASAALPFCLERAEAGDVVEWQSSSGEWWEIQEFKKSNSDKFAFVGTIDDEEICFDACESRLRMKYPPKSKGAA